MQIMGDKIGNGPDWVVAPRYPSPKARMSYIEAHIPDCK